MTNAITSDPARPINAPLRALAAEVEKMIARVKITVSTPSRPTAWNDSSARPHLALPSSAASVLARSSLDSDLA